MLRSLKNIGEFGLQAKDGEIGAVQEFYFDDRQWMIRYMVFKAHLLSGMRVLVTPKVLEKPNWEHKLVKANLTKAQIERSPEVDIHKPASRQDEEKLVKYYGWESYWSDSDSHLQSSKDLMGYEVQGKGGAIGKIVDFIFDDNDWRLRYMIVDTGDWLPSRQVPLSIDWINLVVTDKHVVNVGIAKSDVAQAPVYDSRVIPTREFESKLYRYYQKPEYWG